jgi:hypothetical protein
LGGGRNKEIGDYKSRCGNIPPSRGERLMEWGQKEIVLQANHDAVHSIHNKERLASIQIEISTATLS